MTHSPIDLEALNEFLKNIASFTEDLIFQGKGIESIYHYTDLNALKGIIYEHDLWLTHSHYSNDEEELTHGHQIVEEVLDELSHDNSFIRFSGKGFIDEVRSNYRSRKTDGIYICCFCERVTY